MAYDNSVIRTILRVGNEMGMTQRQLIAGLQGGIVESGLRNLHYGERDSRGVFQQRPSMGWGTVAQVTDPEYAARKFFTELKKVWNDDRSNGHNVQHVQRSAFPDRYDQRLKEAQAIFRQFGNELGGGGEDGKQKIRIPLPGAPDDDTDIRQALGEPDDPFDETFEEDLSDLDEVWMQAINVMGDEVRGQFDPNGDLFDEEEPEDTDELLSADEYGRMLSGNQSLLAGDPNLLEFEEDSDEFGGTPTSFELDAANIAQQQQEAANLAAAAQSRRRAMDLLDAMAKGSSGTPTRGLPRISGFGGSKSIPAGVRPNTANGARVIREMGFGGTIGGIGQRGYKSDHPDGNALDAMVGLSRKGNVAGWQIANYFHTNRGKLNVKYIIFDNKIASSRDNWRWRPYNSTPDGNTSPTALHEDHVHISFY